MENQDLGNKNNNSSSYLCRQSSSRWTPTSDQIRILKELYYNNGIRSPTADQIQRIAARLRHYGKIEGKNVFYWFQNHKARERQKKRLTPPDHHHHNHHVPYFYNHQQLNIHAAHHFSPPAENAAAAASSSSLQPFIPVGCAYGSIAMEKSFRECWVSSGGESRVSGEEMHNLGSWVGNRQPESDETADEESGEMETLPLFPIHHEIINSVSQEGRSNDGSCYTGENWLLSEGRTSLELTLNSYHYYHN